MRKPPVRLQLTRGVGLLDALVALALLAFGLLGMTRLQARMVAQATESQTRMTALQLGDELLNSALVDTANAACYTLPQAGACANAGASGGRTPSRPIPVSTLRCTRAVRLRARAICE